METDSMPTNHSSLRYGASLIFAGAALVFSGAQQAAADDSTQADAFPTYESYLKVSGQSPWITGDSAAFATHTGTPSVGSGGIEDFFYTKDISNDTTVKVAGRAIEGEDNYLASIDLAKDGVGSID